MKSPVIVGMGPCGLFCALYLAMSGIKPTIIDRGECVEERIKSIENFWENGKLNPMSNVQFGEGGAGTFSDGKLTCGVNDDRLEFIKEQFVKFGAPEEILYLKKAHIGTDKLREVIKNIRKELIRLGVKVEFNTKLSDINIKNGKIKSIVIEKDNSREIIDCDNLILAIGHSARDTFRMINEKNIKMERKTFSIGGRIEHLQDDIGYGQYGESYKKLPPADYKLAVNTKDGRGVYTFCMCPGGYVVASSSSEKSVVTNGMSYFDRKGKNANSAVLVTVNPSDVEGDDVLGGVKLQEDIEKRAFILGGENYYAPVNKVGDILNNRVSTEFGKVKPTYKPGVKFADLSKVFPKFIWDSIVEALPMFDKKLKGFANDDAIFTIPETRSSSPVRIIRDKENYQCNIFGIYPCGEGAGYAGGIMSAALDGLRCAEKFIENNKK